MIDRRRQLLIDKIVTMTEIQLDDLTNIELMEKWEKMKMRRMKEEWIEISFPKTEIGDM